MHCDIARMAKECQVMFRIRDRAFEIEKATFSGCIWNMEYATRTLQRSRNFAWFVEVQGKEQEIDDFHWEPAIYTELRSLNARPWTEMKGVSISLPTSFNEETQIHDGGIYVWMHDAIRESILNFGGREKNRFDFSWRGLCDIYMDIEGYDSNVPFEIQTPIEFTGVTVFANDSNIALGLLAQHFHPDEYFQHPVEIFGQFEGRPPSGTVLFEPKIV